MLKGIDISVWQGDVDWSRVKDQVDFSIIRAGYGSGYKDKKYDFNRRECIRLGIPHGLYWYAYPNLNSPEVEADSFLRVVGEPEHGEILVLDFEEAYPDPVGWSHKFLKRITEKMDGYKPMIYLNKHTVQSYDWSPVVKDNYGLWLAYWDFDPEAELPELPYWKTVAMRQYTNKNSYAGIPSERVDGNVFYGDLDTFYKYGVQKDELAPEDPPPFNFDPTKRLPENAWNILGYEKLPAIQRSWALDTLGQQYQELSEEYLQKVKECPESEDLQIQIAELITKNKELKTANTDLQEKNKLLNTDNIWLEQDRDSWKTKAQGNLRNYDVKDLVVAILERLKI